MFTHEDIDELPDDLVEAGLVVVTKVLDFYGGVPGGQDREFFTEYAAAYAVLNACLKAQHLEPGRALPDDIDASIQVIVDFCRKQHAALTKMRVDRVSDELALAAEDKFQSRFRYEFSDGDLKIIQSKLNELRDIVMNCDILEADFKDRLLRRLERLQAELHKRMSNLDRFWGLVGDAGVALGRFGEDAKPIFDRVRELVETVWRTQARAEELPTNSPLPELSKTSHDTST